LNDYLLQQREKKQKEAELNQNLLGTAKSRMEFMIVDTNSISKAIPHQIMSRDLDPVKVLGNNPNTAENLTALSATRESLAVTKKRCDDLDRALNQVKAEIVHV
jgi:hypothetical protein